MTFDLSEWSCPNLISLSTSHTCSIPGMPWVQNKHLPDYPALGKWKSDLSIMEELVAQIGQVHNYEADLNILTCMPLTSTLPGPWKNKIH